MDRYADPGMITKTRLDGLPGLVKLAWNIALLFPEFGDEIIADLCADVTAIVEREGVRMSGEADAAAAAKAEEFWRSRVSRAYARGTELTAALSSGIKKDGINPRGWYVYILWPGKDAEKPLYVGRSSNIFARLGSHMNDPQKRYDTWWVSIIECNGETDMCETEGRLIGHYRPRLNVVGNRW